MTRLRNWKTLCFIIIGAGCLSYLFHIFESQGTSKQLPSQTSTRIHTKSSKQQYASKFLKIASKPAILPTSKPAVKPTPKPTIISTSKPVVIKTSKSSVTFTRKPMPTCPPVSLSELDSAKTTENKIPLILHQIYKTENVPGQYVPLIQGCRRINPDFFHLLWTDKVAGDFIKTKYPQYQTTFSKYHEGAQKADFIRVLLLYHFGGVYIDMDVECRKPLSKHLDKFEATAIVDQERRLQTRLRWDKNYTAMNSVMISRKNHPFFKYLLDKFNDSLKHGNVMWRTGPFFLHDRMLEYNRQNRTGLDRIHLASPYSFSPLLDPALFGWFNNKCKGSYKNFGSVRRLGCLEWDRQRRQQGNATELVQNSSLVHKFMHLAYGFMAHAIKKRVDVCTLGNVSKPSIL